MVTKTETLAILDYHQNPKEKRGNHFIACIQVVPGKSVRGKNVRSENVRGNNVRVKISEVKCHW